jgi:hypothetical protein
MQPSSGGFFPSIQFFSTEAAAFVMPILFPDYFEYTWYPCNVAYRWTHLILINVNLVQQDATIQDIIHLIMDPLNRDIFNVIIVYISHLMMAQEGGNM